MMSPIHLPDAERGRNQQSHKRPDPDDHKNGRRRTLENAIDYLKRPDKLSVIQACDARHYRHGKGKQEACDDRTQECSQDQRNVKYSHDSSNPFRARTYGLTHCPPATRTCTPQSICFYSGRRATCSQVGCFDYASRASRNSSSRTGGPDGYGVGPTATLSVAAKCWIFGA